jgi:hypothetical protein
MFHCMPASSNEVYTAFLIRWSIYCIFYQMKYILHFNTMKYILHFNPMKYILLFNTMKYILHFNPMKYILLFSPMKYILHFNPMKHILLAIIQQSIYWFEMAKIYSISVGVCVRILLQMTWENILLFKIYPNFSRVRTLLLTNIYSSYACVFPFQNRNYHDWSDPFLLELTRRMHAKHLLNN